MKKLLLLSLIFFSPLTSIKYLFAEMSSDKQKSAIEKANKILKVVSSLHDNQGISISLNGSFPALVASLGGGVSLEALNIRGNLAFYCSTSIGAGLKSSAGVNNTYSYINTRGCEVPSQYEGLFMNLSASAGVHALVAGGSLAGSISYGVNYPLLVDTIRETFKKDPAAINRILTELISFRTCLSNDEMSTYINALLGILVGATEQVLDTEASFQDSAIRELIKEAEHKLKEWKKNAEDFQSQTECSYKELAHKLYEARGDLFKIAANDIVKDHNIAALLPNKEALAIVIEKVVDRTHYPTLKTFLLEILRRDLSGCDSANGGIDLALGAGTPLKFGINTSLTNYKKIGPSIPLSQYRNFIIDRYVQNDGMGTLKKDATEGLHYVCEGSKCIWRSACDIAKNPGKYARYLKEHNFKGDFTKLCTASSQWIASFLNGINECVVGNYKELLVTPVQIFFQPEEPL